jgi:hypothetical protein
MYGKPQVGWKCLFNQKHVQLLKQQVLFPSRRNFSHSGTSAAIQPQEKFESTCEQILRHTRKISLPMNLPRTLRAYTQNVSSIWLTIQKPNSP